MCKELCIYTAHFAVALIAVTGMLQAQGQPEWSATASFDASRPYRSTWEPGAGERGISPEFGWVRNVMDLPAPRREPASPSPGGQSQETTVSADRLRYPLASKAKKSIDKAVNASSQGDHETAIRLLLETGEKHPSSAPYVHSLLGIEYARTGQHAKAEVELRQAVALMPHEAVNHSNLAYTLFFLGKFAESESAVRRALELDKDNRASKDILSLLLQRKEAVASSH